MRILLYCRNKNIHVYIYNHAFIYNQMHFILSIEVFDVCYVYPYIFPTKACLTFSRDTQVYLHCQYLSS